MTERNIGVELHAVGPPSAPLQHHQSPRALSPAAATPQRPDTAAAASAGPAASTSPSGAGGTSLLRPNDPLSTSGSNYFADDDARRRSSAARRRVGFQIDEGPGGATAAAASGHYSPHSPHVTARVPSPHGTGQQQQTGGSGTPPLAQRMPPPPALAHGGGGSFHNSGGDAMLESDSSPLRRVSTSATRSGGVAAAAAAGATVVPLTVVAGTTGSSHHGSSNPDTPLDTSSRERRRFSTAGLPPHAATAMFSTSSLGRHGSNTASVSATAGAAAAGVAAGATSHTDDTLPEPTLMMVVHQATDRDSASVSVSGANGRSVGISGVGGGPAASFGGGSVLTTGGILGLSAAEAAAAGVGSGGVVMVPAPPSHRGSIAGFTSGSLSVLPMAEIQSEEALAAAAAAAAGAGGGRGSAFHSGGITPMSPAATAAVNSSRHHHQQQPPPPPLSVVSTSGGGPQAATATTAQLSRSVNATMTAGAAASVASAALPSLLSAGPRTMSVADTTTTTGNEATTNSGDGGDGGGAPPFVVAARGGAAAAAAAAANAAGPPPPLEGGFRLAAAHVGGSVADSSSTSDLRRVPPPPPPLPPQQRGQLGSMTSFPSGGAVAAAAAASAAAAAAAVAPVGGSPGTLSGAVGGTGATGSSGGGTITGGSGNLASFTPATGTAATTLTTTGGAGGGATGGTGSGGGGGVNALNVSAGNIMLASVLDTSMSPRQSVWNASSVAPDGHFSFAAAAVGGGGGGAGGGTAGGGGVSIVAGSPTSVTPRVAAAGAAAALGARGGGGGGGAPLDDGGSTAAGGVHGHWSSSVSAVGSSAPAIVRFPIPQPPPQPGGGGGALSGMGSMSTTAVPSLGFGSAANSTAVPSPAAFAGAAAAAVAAATNPLVPPSAVAAAAAEQQPLPGGAGMAAALYGSETGANPFVPTSAGGGGGSSGGSGFGGGGAAAAVPGFLAVSATSSRNLTSSAILPQASASSGGGPQPPQPAQLAGRHVVITSPRSGHPGRLSSPPTLSRDSSTHLDVPGAPQQQQQQQMRRGLSNVSQRSAAASRNSSGDRGSRNNRAGGEAAASLMDGPLMRRIVLTLERLIAPEDVSNDAMTVAAATVEAEVFGDPNSENNTDSDTIDDDEQRRRRSKHASAGGGGGGKRTIVARAIERALSTPVSVHRVKRVLHAAKLTPAERRMILPAAVEKKKQVPLGVCVRSLLTVATRSGGAGMAAVNAVLESLDDVSDDVIHAHESILERMEDRLSAAFSDNRARFADNAARRVWDWIHIVTIVLFFVISTMENVVYLHFDNESRDRWVLSMFIAFTVFWAVDLFASTQVFALDRDGRIIKDVRGIVRCRWRRIAIDSFCLLPVDFIVQAIAVHQQDNSNGIPNAELAPRDKSAMFYTFLAFRVLKYAKVFRLFSMFELVNRDIVTPTTVLFHFQLKRMLIGSISVAMFIWSAAIVHQLVDRYIIADELGEQKFPSMRDSLEIVANMLSSSNGPVFLYTNADKFIFIACGLLSMIGIGFLVGELTVLLFSSSVSAENYLLMRDTLGIMQHYKVPSLIQREALAFQMHALNDDVARHVSNLQQLPPQMQQEIVLYVKVDAVARVPFFAGANDDCKLLLAASLTRALVEPEVEVVRVGDIGTEMFILAHGFADVILGNGKIVTTFTRGDCFGEMALVQRDAKRTATVRALTYCDLWALHKEAFLEALALYPGFVPVVETELRRRGASVEQFRATLAQLHGALATRSMHRKSVAESRLAEATRRASVILVEAAGSRAAMANAAAAAGPLESIALTGVGGAGGGGGAAGAARFASFRARIGSVAPPLQQAGVGAMRNRTQSRVHFGTGAGQHRRSLGGGDGFAFPAFPMFDERNNSLLPSGVEIGSIAFPPAMASVTSRFQPPQHHTQHAAASRRTDGGGGNDDDGAAGDLKDLMGSNGDAEPAAAAAAAAAAGAPPPHGARSPRIAGANASVSALQVATTRFFSLEDDDGDDDGEAVLLATHGGDGANESTANPPRAVLAAATSAEEERPDDDDDVDEENEEGEEDEEEEDEVAEQLPQVAAEAPGDGSGRAESSGTAPGGGGGASGTDDSVAHAVIVKRQRRRSSARAKAPAAKPARGAGPRHPALAALGNSSSRALLPEFGLDRVAVDDDDDDAAGASALAVDASSSRVAGDVHVHAGAFAPALNGHRRRLVASLLRRQSMRGAESIRATQQHQLQQQHPHPSFLTVGGASGSSLAGGAVPAAHVGLYVPVGEAFSGAVLSSHTGGSSFVDGAANISAIGGGGGGGGAVVVPATRGSPGQSLTSSVRPAAAAAATGLIAAGYLPSASSGTSPTPTAAMTTASALVGAGAAAAGSLTSVRGGGASALELAVAREEVSQLRQALQELRSVVVQQRGGRHGSVAGGGASATTASAAAAAMSGDIRAGSLMVVVPAPLSPRGAAPTSAGSGGRLVTP